MTPWTRLLTASCLSGTALAYGCSGNAFLGSGSDAGTSGSSSEAGAGTSGAAASGSAETSGNASGTASGAVGSGATATSGSPTSSSGSSGGSGTAAGSGAGSGSSPSSGSGASSGAGSSGSTAADGGKPCTTSADCADPQFADVGFLCGFPEADGCAAKGTCFQEPGGPMCAAFLPGCACDGSEVNLTCNGLPSGYAPAPLLHSGVCFGPGPVVLPDAGSGAAGK
jgi:hypothetical protein